LAFKNRDPQPIIRPPGTITTSDIILDGGNICYYDNKAIIGDKVLKDKS